MGNLDFAQYAVATPYPGTDLYRQYLETGNPEPDWATLDYGVPASQPFFYPISGKDAGKLYRNFYLRPRYIWQRLIGTRSLDKLKTNISGLIALTRK